MLILDMWLSRSPAFEKTWIKHDVRTWSEWPAYFKVGGYGALLECLGWWNLHICFLFTGYLGVTEVATQVVIM